MTLSDNLAITVVMVKKSHKKWIKALRTNLDESQVKFGKRFKVGQPCVAHWESGRSVPSGDTLVKLVKLAEKVKNG